ncbi:malonyl-CoA decarboxylase, mitochondrial-like [Venturia canescens]|uniref:malonyl-CoA decarboxylase, mitochondrial-like n=1 Tax=Venturia canescens TaxID=32260 RepID=UPI001C9C023D|nr:malonyl-CoA decarboxylase, mitochondrial-like [Venturia canescens]
MAKIFSSRLVVIPQVKHYLHSVVNDTSSYISKQMSLRLMHSNNDSTAGAILKEIFRYKDTGVTNWIIEAKVEKLCSTYVEFSKKERNCFLWQLASQYSVDHENICSLSEKLGCIKSNYQRELVLRERILKNALTPRYQWLFILMGRLEHGVKFLVDLRTDILELLSEVSEPEKAIVLQQLNSTLHDLLFLWFSVGFLHLERITWQSSCEMLQKISDYEANHPIKNWLDLKRRVGLYRRCFVFTHPSMPREPLVVLHTALCDLIPETVRGIDEADKRIISRTEDSKNRENKSEIKAAIFYSIASTQKGLKGIDLGNYMIKEVVKEVKREFPMIDQLSTLSPIPKFRAWFFEKLKQDTMKMFTSKEEEILQNLLRTHDLKTALRKLLNNSLWTSNDEITRVLKDPLIRSCAWYLYREKHRNYALDKVANFHLRNGAFIWRINWMADPSPRGAENSCGIMVNYRYDLNETEENSRSYIESNTIKASESVIRLAEAVEVLRQLNNGTK